MTGDQTVALVGGAALGALAARPWLKHAIAAAPQGLTRKNYAGRSVPAVLGLPLLLGGLVGLGGVYLLQQTRALDVTSTRVALASCVVVVVAALAGYADDRRGDEPARGFAGHIRAALGGRVTGGLVKIVGVGLAGLAAGLILGGGWFALELGVLIALSANLVNLFDRAPGRAAKVVFAVGIVLFLLGDGAWSTVAGGFFGALAVCAVADLGERAMLGDAGANPLGALIGLGLGVSLGREGRWVVLVVLVVVNLASEKWSFSRGIERVGWLRALDRLGRG
ncbi:MAG: hypothetical protein M3198_04410 [Actinomycetota bacterium]|nr:hypothetical protein [Actinomycetota bacterium]